MKGNMMHTDSHSFALPVFSAADETSDWFEPLPGERMRVRIGSDATGGRLTLLENEVAAGAAAPNHFHHDADELFIVLDGRFRVSSGTDQIDAGPGAAIFVPRGTAHAFFNDGRVAARLLSVFLPGGMEAMFREAAFTRLEEIPAMAARHGTVVIGAAMAD
jgi:mannose-6-phosphate isomerase-like protein (cupin superfamily)